jgi:hypothetical protein
MSPSPPTPYRQIRAHYDEKTVTVYQAYSSSIALTAVAKQSLSASPLFSVSRMTWIKPSFCWMMYRSAYGTKDARQSHILAIKMTHENFRRLLEQAVVCSGKKLNAEERKREVRVQWDPERGPGLEERSWRSLQVGIGRGVVEWWVREGIAEIEDVSEMAARLRVEMERQKKDGKKRSVEELVEMGCLPEERVYEVPEELRVILKMDVEPEKK